MSILWKRVHHSKKDIGIAIDFPSIVGKTHYSFSLGDLIVLIKPDTISHSN